MVLFNYSTKELTAKVVYYGPGLCGKTTNLQWIHDKSPIKNKGKMVSLATETDRTLFFDFLPIELGTIRGMKTRIQLYTVPGQVFYNATRRMVLRGADCVVFVADRQDTMLTPNQDSLDNLRENLEANDIDFEDFPMVLQYNKRDLPNALPIEELNAALNPRGVPYYEAVAVEGKGVEDTLKGATALVFKALAGRYGGAADQAAADASEPPPSTPIMQAQPEPEPEIGGAEMFSPDSLLDSTNAEPPPATASTAPVPEPAPEPAADSFSADLLLELQPEPAEEPEPLAVPELALEPESAPADSFSPDSLLDSIEMEPEPAAEPEPAPEPEPPAVEAFSPDSLLDSIEMEPEPAAEPVPGGFSPDSLLDSFGAEAPANDPAPVSEADLEPIGAAPGAGETGLEELSLEPEPEPADSPLSSLEASPLEELTGGSPAATDDVLAAVEAPAEEPVSELEALTGGHPAVTDDVLAAASDASAPELQLSPFDELAGSDAAPTDHSAEVEPEPPELDASPLAGLTGGHPAVTDDVLAGVGEDAAPEPSLSPFDDLPDAAATEPPPELDVSPLEELTGGHPAVTDDDLAAATEPPPELDVSPLEELTGGHPAVTDDDLAAASDPTPELDVSPLAELTGGHAAVTDEVLAAASEDSSPELPLSPLEELTGGHPAVTDDVLAAAESEPEPSLSPFEQLTSDAPPANEDPWATPAEPGAPEIAVSPLDDLTGGEPAVTDAGLAAASAPEIPELKTSPLDELAGGPPDTEAHLAVGIEPDDAPEPFGEATERAMPAMSLDDLTEEAPEPPEAPLEAAPDESALDELAGSPFGDADELSPAPESAEMPVQEVAPFDSGFDLDAEPAPPGEAGELAVEGSDLSFGDSTEELGLGAEPEAPSFDGEQDVDAPPGAEVGVEAVPSFGEEVPAGAPVGEPEAAVAEALYERPPEEAPAPQVVTQEATVSAAAVVPVPVAFAHEGAI